MDPDGRPLGLLITQRSRVQIPPPPPTTTRAFATSGGRPSGTPGVECSRLAHIGRLCEFGSCFPVWLRLLADSVRTRLRVLGDSGSGRWVTVTG